MKLLKKGTFLDNITRDHHPDKETKNFERELFQKAYFYNHNHMV
ncbi:hypothetical protein [Halonatronomonas betaini]|nr:hypothetical protein [Halonatronomonas betaini]